MANGEESNDKEEEMLALAVGKQVEQGVGPEQLEPDTGAKEVAVKSGEKAVSVKDIIGD